MWVVQNAGIGGANLVAGWLNDTAGASSMNPAGYLPMMEFFIASSVIGFAFAWRCDGPPGGASRKRSLMPRRFRSWQLQSEKAAVP
jgi:hypothetical protein